MWQKINNYKEKNYLKWNTFTYVGILLIIVCGIKVTFHLEHYMDVLFNDEALYLSRGVSMFPHVPKTWGPSYSLWYKFLSFFIHDKITLYYFNYKLLTILICVSLFLLMLSCGVQQVLAFIFSIFFLSSFINLPVWPHISHYCIILIITGLLLAKNFKTLVAKFAIYTLVLMICAYARPELFLPFLIFWLLTYLLFIINWKMNNTPEFILVSALTVMSVVIYKILKTPLNSGDTGRSAFTLLQHFAFNYNTWYPSKAPFWLEFPYIVKQKFNGATDIKSLIAANPELLKRHFTFNAILYFEKLGEIIFSFFAPIFAKKIHWLYFVVCSMLFIIYFSFTKTLKNKSRRFLSLIKENLLTILLLMLIAFPSVLVCIYAYPRDHYLILQVPFLLIIITLAISSIGVETMNPIPKIIVVATVCFFVMPVAEDFNYFNLFREEQSLANLQTIKYITKNFSTTDSISTFDEEGDMSTLLTSNFSNYSKQFLHESDSIKLSDFLISKQFDIIYKTPTLSNLTCVQKDTIFFDMLKNPAKYGYREQKTGAFIPCLLIKNINYK